MMTVDDALVYRIVVRGSSSLTIMCLGLESVDSLLRESYDSFDDLPDWVKDRLAVLSIMPIPPPRTEIDGVGMRISDRVFWVYAPNNLASTSA